MRLISSAAAVLAAAIAVTTGATSQTYTSPDPVIRRIFDEGMDRSKVCRSASDYRR